VLPTTGAEDTTRVTEATLEAIGELTMEIELLLAATAEVGTTVTADEAELVALVAGGAWIWPSEI